MPILVPGARGLIQGQWLYYALHKSSPPSEKNEVMGAGYARVATSWVADEDSFEPDAPVHFNAASVASWGIIRAVSVWNGNTANSELMGYVVLPEAIDAAASEDETVLAIDAERLRVQIAPGIFTEAGVRALLNGTLLTVPSRITLHTDDNGSVGPELDGRTNTGYAAVSRTATLFALRQAPRVEIYNPGTLSISTPRGDWVDTPAWLGVSDNTVPETPVLLMQIPTGITTPPTQAGGALIINPNGFSIDMLQGTALEAGLPPTYVTDAFLNTSTAEADNTDIAPSRRAVAAAIETSRTAIQADQPNLDDVFDGARISGNRLIFEQRDGTEESVTLPTSTEVADGVVVSAVVDPNTRMVTLTTSTGDTINMDLSSFVTTANQRFTAADETKLDGIEERAERNVGVPFEAADEIKLDGIAEGAQVNVGVEFTQEEKTKLDGITPGAGSGLSTVSTDSTKYITGDGSVGTPVALDDASLLRDWIGDYDTPIPGSASGGGTAAAAPGNYAWRNMGANHQVVSATQHQDNRRLQGDVALSVTRIVGAGAVGYRVVFNDGAGTNVGIVKFADTGEDTQRFDVPTGAGTVVAARLQVQGAGEYTATVTYTNRRFHDGDGVLKDEIQAEIHAGTQHLTDNLVSDVTFTPQTRNMTVITEGGDQRVVNIPEQDISDLFKDAEINGGILRLTRENDTAVNLTLPTGTAVADGVVVSATLNQTTKRVTITTSTGDTIALDLANMAALREVEPYARVGNSARVPDARIDTAIARTSALPRTGQLVPAGGTGGQVLGKTSATDYDTTWVDAGEGGGSSGGNTTHLVGQGNFDVTDGAFWALEANSADILLDDSDWFHVAVRDNSHASSYERIFGDEWRGLTAGTYGTHIVNSGSQRIQVAFLDGSGGLHSVVLGRTADNKVLFSSTSVSDDAMPLIVRGSNEATPPTFLSLPETPNTPGGPGQSLIWNPAGDALVNADRGEGGVVTLEAGQSELSFGPVRQTTRGIVPDDTAALPNLTEFDLPFSTGGRTLDEGLTVSTDNLSLRSANGGIYLVQVSLHGLASSDPSRQVDISANGVFRPEGELIIYRNTVEVGRVSFSYARYARWQTDGNGEIPVIANAGDRISFAVNLRRVDAIVGSVNWRGVTHLSRLHVTGNALPGAGIESETVDNIVTLTQAQYDALASPSGSTLYVISG